MTLAPQLTINPTSAPPWSFWSKLEVLNSAWLIDTVKVWKWGIFFPPRNGKIFFLFISLFYKMFYNQCVKGHITKVGKFNKIVAHWFLSFFSPFTLKYCGKLRGVLKRELLVFAASQQFFLFLLFASSQQQRLIRVNMMPSLHRLVVEAFSLGIKDTAALLWANPPGIQSNISSSTALNP